MSERRNRTLLDMVRSIISRTDLPIFFEDMPSRVRYLFWTGFRQSLLDRHRILYGQERNRVSHSCRFEVVRPKAIKKLKAPTYIYKVFNIWNTEEILLCHPWENKIFVALHVVFLEKKLITAMNSGRKVELDVNPSKTDENTSFVEPMTSHDDVTIP